MAEAPKPTLRHSREPDQDGMAATPDATAGGLPELRQKAFPRRLTGSWPPSRSRFGSPVRPLPSASAGLLTYATCADRVALAMRWRWTVRP